MANRGRRLMRVLLAMSLVANAVFVWMLRDELPERLAAVISFPAAENPNYVPPVEDGAPLVVAETVATPEPTPDPVAATPSPSPNAESSSANLLIPVEGVRSEDLQDTYTASRSGGREHDAIDIIAPRGTPVVAVTDGTIVKLFRSVPGGITIYQLDPDDRTIYYYAHLERYADGLAENHFARRGEVIGYVGDTGNSGAGNYHLHFSVSIVSDPKRWWDGRNINPYPLLRK
ncbi:MAG: peptidoglycan DD-metalloendopeptidase family protein [Pyrinomonadaceae bacterium]